MVFSPHKKRLVFFGFFPQKVDNVRGPVFGPRIDSKQYTPLRVWSFGTPRLIAIGAILRIAFLGGYCLTPKS